MFSEHLEMDAAAANDRHMRCIYNCDWLGCLNGTDTICARSEYIRSGAKKWSRHFRTILFSFTIKPWRGSFAMCTTAAPRRGGFLRW